MAEIVPVLVVGGAFGIGVAAVAVNAFVPLAPASLPRSGQHRGRPSRAARRVGGALDRRRAGCRVAGRAGVGLRSGAASRDGSRGATGAPRQARIRQALVVAQIALSLPLLTAAVLLTRSFTSVVSIDPGFRSDKRRQPSSRDFAFQVPQRRAHRAVRSRHSASASKARRACNRRRS